MIRRIVVLLVGALLMAGFVTVAAAPANAATPVTPGVTVVDECGTTYDRVRVSQVRGGTYNVIDRPEDGYAIVRFTPAPGYTLVPEPPFYYDAHANSATAYIDYSNDLPCWPN